MTTITIEHYLILSIIIFCMGILGVLFRRNAIIILMSIELMLNAVNLLLVAFTVFNNDAAGQILVFFIMVVAAAEATVGLSIIVMLYRNFKSIDINLLDKLKW